MSFQTITLVGNLGRDPEMRYTPSGQAVTNLSIATNYVYTNNNGERVKETTWFRVSVWGKQAEACNQYLRSGSQVLVEGRMNQDKATGSPRIWTANDGTPKASYEITASEVKFLNSRSGNQTQPAQAQPSQSAMMPPDEDEPPF